jgi:hypothetical protein
MANNASQSRTNGVLLKLDSIEMEELKEVTHSEWTIPARFAWAAIRSIRPPREGLRFEYY